ATGRLPPERGMVPAKLAGPGVNPEDVDTCTLMWSKSAGRISKPDRVPSHVTLRPEGIASTIGAPGDGCGSPPSGTTPTLPSGCQPSRSRVTPAESRTSSDPVSIEEFPNWGRLWPRLTV